MTMAQRVLIAFIRVYQMTISPMLMVFFGPAGRCRFTPSCSQYALEAVRTHGALRGAVLALRRLGRCHPWGKHGEDMVPARGTVDYLGRKREGCCGLLTETGSCHGS